MKKVFILGAAAFLLFLWGCTQGDSPQEEPVDWPYGGVIAHRNDRMSSYSRAEIDGCDFITSSEGSLVTGYYENEKLQIIKIAIYQSRHRVILRFYPLGEAVAMIGETIIYATDKPLSEITEDDLHLRDFVQAVIADGQVHHYIDHQSMYPVNDSWYAEVYVKAVEALGNAG